MDHRGVRIDGLEAGGQGECITDWAIAVSYVSHLAFLKRESAHQMNSSCILFPLHLLSLALYGCIIGVGRPIDIYEHEYRSTNGRTYVNYDWELYGDRLTSNLDLD